MKSIKTDYHIHPNYSIDASPVQMKDYCYQALELGLAEICFTTHVELDPVRSEMDNFAVLDGERIPVLNHTWLEKYFLEITGLQEEFKMENLGIKAGVEIGYCRGVEKDIEKIINNYPFDYVMGAIHCLDHIAISSRKESPRYFQAKSLHALRADYFTTLKEAVATGFFDCIAHVDLYRRYGIQHYGPGVLSIHRGVIEPIFREMARREMGLEINTSSIRRGLNEFHPTREIIDLAAKEGLKVFTVGSDAHTPGELGEYIDEALALLEEFNLSNHVFTRRRARPII
ncbi:histidinol-phosphatase HisJ family protein [Desulfallas thermosapovorans]|uniref:Histidinol-phosphatase n=1 Tax=Desulfallas thermosapovorans DSM 6562 TaxID=1121431 RepID=A0A5S4ZUK5_9FIRM|nr:histidinol-phosphatase HisJ family protein [Desulfallas thermosapovorans]TYO96474.1 histidinol-phosphatase (PHP family) [Desulfallas thermosapovorans DSM 6562]